MHQPRGRVLLGRIFPRIDPELRPEFRTYERRIARRITVAASLAIILVIPAVQLLETWVIRPGDQVLYSHLLIRTPVLVLALVILGLWYWRPEGQWPRPVALLFGVVMVAFVTTRFGHDLQSPAAPLEHASHPLILVIMIAAVVATRGVRDLALVFGLPTAGLLLYLWQAETALVREELVLLVYPFLAMIIAGYIAHVLHGLYIDHFLATREMRQHAMTDPLTGLLNRRAMGPELEARHAAAAPHGRSFAVLMTDLDHFKQVNDIHGHEVGDEVLVAVSTRMAAQLRREDRLCRWGGEEFLVLLDGVSDAAAMAVAEKLRRAVADTPVSTAVGAIEITMSLGVATCRDCESAEALVTCADEALYRAKIAGRNRCIAAQPATAMTLAARGPD